MKYIKNVRKNKKATECNFTRKIGMRIGKNHKQKK